MFDLVTVAGGWSSVPVRVAVVARSGKLAEGGFGVGLRW